MDVIADSRPKTLRIERCSIFQAQSFLQEISSRLTSFIWCYNNSDITQTDILEAVTLSNSKLSELAILLRQNSNETIDYNNNSSNLKRLELLKLNDENATDLSSIITSNKYTLRRVYFHRMYRLKSDKLIASLLDCTKIEELNLNQCYQMSELTSVLEKHSLIYSLHLANTQPSQNTLGAILTLTNLQKLDLGCNHRVNNSFVKMMSNCLPNLYWLSLEQCHVDDDAVEALEKLNLKDLNLSHTLITAEALQILYHSKLHTIDLSNCTRIENALESVNRFLTRVPSLYKIGLRGFEKLVIDAAKSFRIEVAH